MSGTHTLNYEQQIDLEAEILRHLWYEAQATPAALAGVLHQSLPVLHECLKDLSHRGFVYQFWISPEGPDRSIYCLTRQTERKLQRALQHYTRYKLQSFWEALKREQRLGLASLQV